MVKRQTWLRRKCACSHVLLGLCRLHRSTIPAPVHNPSYPSELMAATMPSVCTGPQFLYHFTTRATLGNRCRQNCCCAIVARFSNGRPLATCRFLRRDHTRRRVRPTVQVPRPQGFSQPLHSGCPRHRCHPCTASVGVRRRALHHQSRSVAAPHPQTSCPARSSAE